MGCKWSRKRVCYIGNRGTNVYEGSDSYVLKQMNCVLVVRAVRTFTGRGYVYNIGDGDEEFVVDYDTTSFTEKTTFTRKNQSSGFYLLTPVHSSIA